VQLGAVGNTEASSEEEQEADSTDSHNGDWGDIEFEAQIV